MNNKKGVSPMISTVLLIVIVIILAIIILLWSRGFIKEAITKEIANEEKEVSQRCLEVNIERIINEDGSFGFSNKGNVPINAYNVKLVSGGKSEVIEISSEDGGTVNPGFTTIVEKSKIEDKNYGDFETIKIIPILLGRSKDSGVIKPFTCSEESGFLI